MADLFNITGLFSQGEMNVTPIPDGGGGTVCENTAYDMKYWIQLSVIPSIIIIIVFSFLQPRVRLWPKCCAQRPSIPEPSNFIDAYEDRLSYACAFAAMSTCVVLLFTGDWFFNPDISHIPGVFQGTVLIFIAIVNVFEISVVYYPILLCLSTEHKLTGNVIGLIYSTVWSFYYVAVLLACPKEEGIVGKIVTAVLGPVFICYIGLEIRFGYGIYTDFRRLVFQETDSTMDKTAVDSDIDEEFKKTHFYERVQYLLRKPTPEVGEPSLTVKWRRKLIDDAPGFKFSRRIVCTFVLSSLTTYQLGLVYIMSLSSVWESANASLAINGSVYNIFERSNETATFYELKDFFDIAESTFWGTCYFAIVTTVLYSFHMQICYRKHTLRLWKGNKNFCPREDFSFDSLVVANLRYSGYHIGFSAWGFFILQIVSWALVFFVTYGIIYPLSKRMETALLNLLNDYWLSFVVGLILYYAQVFLSRLAFLQADKEDKKKKKKKTIHLSLNNRRAFNVTVYITLFMNVLLGLISCLMRILKAVVFGVLFIGRIDRCTLMRGWELWDPGFKAYIGFIQLEVAHTHPVVVTFCHLLWKSIGKNKFTSAQLTSYKTFDIVEEGQKTSSPTKSTSEVKSRRARNRWFVAITLMRNRALTINRVPILPELQQVQEESRDKTDHGLVKYAWLNKTSPPMYKSDRDHLMTNQEAEKVPSSVPIETFVHIKPPAKKTVPKETDSSDVTSPRNSPLSPNENDPLLVGASGRDGDKQSARRTDINSGGVVLKLENNSTETDI
ncbi:stimulated by retinoic acid gene 6 protein-like isoform X1 [Asterias rubens]|uniref:stimulated by retinoic acid gene 6 protein-like isoform X1 n=1 Tax=Asterias rubens TaxID=7604 RepID=UPI001454FF9F|nr:stimulated by retinoic acid gene 6 protein-like isoform X1 [Asterias rubens]